jgi:hypothetical protein
VSVLSAAQSNVAAVRFSIRRKVIVELQRHVRRGAKADATNACDNGYFKLIDALARQRATIWIAWVSASKM